MTIKSFRGKIIDGGIDTVVLHTNTGSTGYRIKKFEIMSARPGSSGSDAEHTVKIFSIPQTVASVTNAIDFQDNTLLAAATMGNSATTSQYGSTPVIVFDNMVFNQDIYITHKETSGAEDVNYYIELEQVTLDLNENTVATLKDIRNITQP
jgi:hypothetical protein